MRLTFEEDAQGNLTVHIEGIKGPVCEKVQKDIENLLGKPSSERRTPEYYQRVQGTQTVGGH